MIVKRLMLILNLVLSGISICFVQCTSSSDSPLPEPLILKAEQTAITKKVFLIGDQLELFVKEDSTLNGVYLVREGGYIVIPRAGRLMVKGMTREEAEPQVRDFLRKSQLKEATVIVERIPSGRVGALTSSNGENNSAQRIMIYITGNVPRSGAHLIPAPDAKPIGVYEALLISGGLGKFASVERVEVFRKDASGNRKKATIDLRPIIRGEATDPPISEGDIINIKEKVFGF